MFLECRRFLASLEDTGWEAVKVAQCFVDQFDEFIIYAEFCTNYPRSEHIDIGAILFKSSSHYYFSASLHITKWPLKRSANSESAKMFEVPENLERCQMRVQSSSHC